MDKLMDNESSILMYGIEPKLNQSPVEQLSVLNETVTDKLNREIIDDLRSNLSRVLFQKDYMHTRVTEYLALMYSSINDNQFIINALDNIKKMDTYTFIHSINTAFYSMFIAIWMGLSEEEIIHATQAGLLHDIGKIYIPNQILNKPGRLEDEEYELIKKHPVYGYFLLNEFTEFSKEVKNAVLFHHERIDNSGYPLSALSECVSIIARIVAVADVYDAMTTDRVYKKKIIPTNAIEFFKKEGYHIFDNYVLEVFLENIPVYDFKHSDKN